MPHDSLKVEHSPFDLKVLDTRTLGLHLNDIVDSALCLDGLALDDAHVFVFENDFIPICQLRQGDSPHLGTIV